MKAVGFVFFQIDLLGQKFLNIIHYTYDVFMMIYLSFRAAIFDQTQSLRATFSVVSMQIYFTGWQALPLITVLSIASGGVVIMQSSAQLSLLGGNEMIGNLLVVIIVREVAPLLTALVVIARSGTAVASEIGNMKVNSEIEALEVMGINPSSYIVFPRILGGIISVFCLSFYFIFIALMGGFLATKLMHDMPFSFYLESLARAFEAEDVVLLTFKNLFSGSIIFVVCCYQGLLVKQSSHEVPQMTTKAVVNSMIYVIAFNLTVTSLYYLNKLFQMGIL